MEIEQVPREAFAMPLTNPAFPPGPYRFINREYMIITYRTDRNALTTRTSQVIPVTFGDIRGGYTHAMFLNDHPPIAGGRELVGISEKAGIPVA